MKTWEKVVLIGVPTSILALTAAIYGCWTVASKAIPDMQSKIVDPKFAATVANSMVGISDPPPANFAYDGAVDMLISKVVILTRKKHFIVLVQSRESRESRDALALKKSWSKGSPFGPLTSNSFEAKSSGKMPIADGFMEYQLGRCVGGSGVSFNGMMGLLCNAQGEPRVLIESFDRSKEEFDFGLTKQFLNGLTSIK